VSFAVKHLVGLGLIELEAAQAWRDDRSIVPGLELRDRNKLGFGKTGVNYETVKQYGSVCRANLRSMSETGRARVAPLYPIH
jgi:hypothetical protein